MALSSGFRRSPHVESFSGMRRTNPLLSSALAHSREHIQNSFTSSGVSPIGPFVWVDMPGRVAPGLTLVSRKAASVMGIMAVGAFDSAGCVAVLSPGAVGLGGRAPSVSGCACSGMTHSLRTMNSAFSAGT